MEIIFRPNVRLKSIVGINNTYNRSEKFSLSKYGIVNKQKDFVIIYNGLNKSMVTLQRDEYENISFFNENMVFLYENWFLINESYDISQKGDLVQNYIINNKPDKNFKMVKTFTIFPTTGCNAKCFYCFENGSQKKHMTLETADKVVNFMVEKHQNNPIKIRWFGGEPLVNEKIIDYISNKLKDLNVEYSSTMTSNGFLISADKIEKYKDLWKLKKMSITIDGTKDVYNNIKQFTYDGCAYERVLCNVMSLIENGISVSLRINIGMHNIDDCETLVYELIERFKDKKNLKIYLNRLYDENEKEVFNESEIESVYNKIIELTEVLRKNGKSIYRFRANNKSFSTAQCMADNGHSLMILPDGKLGLCEHYLDTLHVGDIENGVTDMENVEKCAKMREKDDICLTCPIYPTCCKIEICNSMPCNKFSLKHDFYYIKLAMLMEYRKYIKSKNK